MDEDRIQSRNIWNETTPPQGCLEPPSSDRPLIVRAPLSPTVEKRCRTFYGEVEFITCTVGDTTHHAGQGESADPAFGS
jgi:hypothetical protein